MLGVVLVSATCLAVSVITWRTGALRYDKRECSLIEKYLREPSVTSFKGSSRSRPERLIRELDELREQPALVVNLLNEVLSEVDHETEGAQRLSRACSRVALTAGMAGACIEIALRLEISTARAVILAMIAAMLGIAGALSCAVIGQWAMRGTLLRRRLWDDFVQSILNSQFSQTAWSVRAPGLRPTNDLHDGQRT